MITQYSDANKVETAKQVVTYSSKPYVWSDALGNSSVLYYELTRKSSSSFKYVGMTKEAAETCAADMRTAWTKKYAYWTVNLVDSGEETVAPNVVVVPVWQLECQTAIQSNLMDGSMWQTDVNLNETDVIISLTLPENEAAFKEIFAAAEARDIPISTGSIAILTAKWTGQVGGEVVIDYQQRIASYDRTKMKVQVWDEENETWETDNRATIAADGHTARVPASANIKLRMAYDSAAIVSDSFTSTGVAMPTMTISNINYEEAYNDSSNSYPGVYTMYSFDLVLTGGWASVYTIDKRYLEFWTKQNGSTDAHRQAKIESISLVRDNEFRVTARVDFHAPNMVSGVSCHANITYMGQYIVSNEATWHPETYLDLYDLGQTFPTVMTHEGNVIKIKSGVKSSFGLSDSTFIAKVSNWQMRHSGAYTTGVPEWREVTASSFTLTQIAGGDGTYELTAEFTVTDSDEFFFRGDVFYVQLFAPKSSTTISSSRSLHQVLHRPAAVTTFNVNIGSVATGAVAVRPTMVVESGFACSWNWGDGSTVETGLETGDAPENYTYGSIGNKEIKVTGHLTSFSGNNQEDPYIKMPSMCSIKSANLSWTVTSIGANAFAVCESLESVSGEGVTSIGDDAFNDDSSLTSVNLPNVTTIGSNAFCACDSVTELKFNKATSIAQYAFSYCDSLSRVEIASATSIGSHAFDDVPNTVVVVLTGKRTDEIIEMTNYPWGLARGTIIYGSNGTVEVA